MIADAMREVSPLALSDQVRVPGPAIFRGRFGAGGGDFLLMLIGEADTNRSVI